MTRDGVVVLAVGDRLKIAKLAEEGEWVRVVEIDRATGGVTVVPDKSEESGAERRRIRGLFV